MSRSGGFFWSPETMEWYLRAAEYESYHRDVAELILPYLQDGGTVCDLGCGPGRLALALMPHVKKITAIDADPLAIQTLRQDGEEITGLEIIEGDAMALPEGAIWDHLLLSFFGRIMTENHLDYFMEHCRESMICIINAAPKSSFSATGRSAHRKEYAPAVAEYVASRGFRYEMIPRTLEFGQPLLNLADARRFMGRHSPEQCALPDDDVLLAKLRKLPDGRLYLPYHKEIAVLVIYPN